MPIEDVKFQIVKSIIILETFIYNCARRPAKAMHNNRFPPNFLDLLFLSINSAISRWVIRGNSYSKNTLFKYELSRFRNVI